ncbi:MAG TPA: MBL fold metallo-hydrolase [Mycobacteriales bacterium]|nr:MBL fold metallo-hydrolase [Mycobacteriales bacterium]
MNTVRLVGGPTTLIEIGGLRLLTDPTFDPPGPYPIGGRTLEKTRGPAVPAAEIGAVDAVLLSHDQHPDNLDAAGREFLAAAPVVLTTAAAAERLGGTARELPSWRHHTLTRPGGGELRVTGVPAQHGPDGTTDLTGPVTGFVLTGDGLPTVYVSGDNASLPIVQSVVDHLGPIDVAVLFAGGARTPLLDAYLTLTNELAARAAAILRPARVVPAHTEGWGHFSADRTGLPAAFARHGTTDQLVLLEPGGSTAF